MSSQPTFRPGAAPPNLKPAVNAIAFGCMGLFLVPFILAGLYMIVSGAGALARGEAASQSWAPMIFGVFFGGIPLLIGVMLVSGQRAQARRATMLAQNPDKPWIYRQEWVNGLITDRNAGVPWVYLIFSIILTAVAIPAVLAFRNDLGPQKIGLLVALLFPLVGLALFISAMYRLMRWHKFGVSRLRLDRVPIEPGRSFRAQVETHIQQVPPGGFNVRLSCIERITTGSGKNRSTRESVLWMDDQTIREGTIAPTPVGLRIPVSFTPPADAQPTDEANSNDAFLWRLDVTTDEPGIDYDASFELPVFNTANAPHTAVHFATPQVAEVAGWQPQADSMISVIPIANGEEVRVATHAHFGEIAGFGFFTLIWLGVVALLFRLHAPSFLGIIFGAFGVLLLWGFVDFTLGRSTIRASREGVVITRKWLGIASSRTIATQDVAAAATTVGAGTGRTPYFNVMLKLKNGSQVVAAKYVRSRKDAEVLAAKILKDCGVPLV